MLRKISFWKKILFFHLFVVLGFLFLIFPSSRMVLNHLAYRTMKVKARDLIQQLQQQPDSAAAVEFLKKEELNVFFYMTLVDERLHRLLDTRRPNREREDYALLDAKEQPKVYKVLRKGKIYTKGDSEHPWCYGAFRFYLNNKPYVLMFSLTKNQMKMWMDQFRGGIFTLDICLFSLFGLILWWGTTRFTKPLHEIVHAVKPFSLNKTNLLSPIQLRRKMSPEFKHIVSSLNTLSDKMKEQARQLVDERHEKEALLEALMEGVVGIDRHGKVHFVNYAAAHMLGSSRRLIIGKDFLPAENHPKIELFKRCQHIVKLALEREDIVTDSLTLGDNQKTYLDLVAVPKPFRAGALLILQDKSSQYKIVEMGKDFIANASHELRTPITIIKGYAETLQDLPSISRPMLSEITEKIVRNCHRMDNLVKNLLILADIEYIPESRFQPCDMVALTDNCKHLLLTLYPHTQIDIEKSHDKILVEANPDLLELALMNLLENGVKYSTKPAHLTVYLKEQGDETVVAVQDRGVGIPQDDLPHIFERFYTVDKTHSRRLGGAGLGLSIVKTIIEKHEGSVSVASVVGQGTTFTLQLPQHRHAYQGAGR